MKRIPLLLAAMLLALAVVGAAGCGDDDETDTGAGGATAETTAETGAMEDEKKAGGKELAIAAASDGSLKFDKTELTAQAGEVTIVMDNPSAVPHAVSVEGNGVDEEGSGGTAGVGQGETSTVTANLEPGTYTFYCPVPGHEEGGMKGTLTVE